MPKDHTPKQRQQSSNSSNPITLDDIKSLMEAATGEIVKNFVEKIDALTSNITSLTSIIESLKRQNSVLLAKCNDLESELNILKTTKKNDLTFIAQEVEDRTKRSFNFIISGVIEPTSSSTQVRHSEDESKCADILQAMGLSDDDEHINEVLRIGKIREDRPRLLKVKCSNSKFRDTVLRHAKLLRKQKEYKNIYIDPDLTPHQQSCKKELLQEYKRRRSNGENIVIYRDRIINRSDNKNF